MDKTNTSKNEGTQKNVENKDASTQFLDDDPELPINTSTNPTNRLSVMNSSESENETFEGDVAENTLRVSLQNSTSSTSTSELSNLCCSSLNLQTPHAKEDNSNNKINIVKDNLPNFCSNQCHPLILKFNRRQQTIDGGQGIDQPQIDAGQMAYGAKQCTQCGLVYIEHEADEEKIHDEYHQIVHVLDFKNWIVKDCVAFHSEWGTLGRIMRIDETSDVEQKEPLMGILKMVDIELGFSSYILPKNYVAFFAIQRQHIMGLCLVQPLDKANKYVCVNGVDCCTNETFEARCGISIIWVSPFDRRMHIASKLIEAVQSKTFEGQTIPLDKIAFSAPTENGKFFAKKVSGQENFLVFQ